MVIKTQRNTDWEADRELESTQTDRVKNGTGTEDCDGSHLVSQH